MKLTDRIDRPVVPKLSLDHPLFRNGIATLLKATVDMQVVAEVATGEEVIEQAATLQPDVILMDLQMHGDGGIKATQRILQYNPLVVLSLKTVANYVSSILTKLQVTDRSQAIVRAREAGFGNE